MIRSIELLGRFAEREMEVVSSDLYYEAKKMFDRRQLVARAVAVVLMFAASGFALAADATKHRSEVRDYLDLADGADIATTNRTGITARADTDDDDVDVIEEIVVIARKKSQHPNLGKRSGTNLVLQMPDGIDWQFLPRYDPEQTDRYFDLIQLDEQIRRAGFIELFRLSFGR